MTGAWHFWIDRGGTFTDVIARRPNGSLITQKLLSEKPSHYKDAAVQGIRDLLECASDSPLPLDRIASVKMGTTVATNALLERKGEPTVWLTTQGFEDALQIGTQARPDLFALDIQLPAPLYDSVVGVSERLNAHGVIVENLDEKGAMRDLMACFASGFRSVAICLLHSYRNPIHEIKLGTIARAIGFTQISLGHEVSSLMKFVPRGDTTVMDAYLSPILRRYVDQVETALLGDANQADAIPRLMFMQSSGGLVRADRFQGKDSLLSGPAGGVIGMVQTAKAAGFERLIGFDMGGTSTDVCHFDGELERTTDGEIAGVRVRAPMMHVHTVAAGGGSLLQFDGARMRVGPDSAGAAPGPASYGNGGPLAVTDCHVLLGRIRPEYFPSVFGASGTQPLDTEAVRASFSDLAVSINRVSGRNTSPRELAWGFLAVAVDNMANAIKEISIQRGYDVSEYTLVCFGGAGGQHACLVAEQLGIQRILIHPHAGVLSALGIGLADVRNLQEQTIEQILCEETWSNWNANWETLELAGREELRAQDVLDINIRCERRVQLRYEGSDSSLPLAFAPLTELRSAFESNHLGRFGFLSPEREILVSSIIVEAIGAEEHAPVPSQVANGNSPKPRSHEVAIEGQPARQVDFYDRDSLGIDHPLDGPAILVEATGTTIVEPGWRAVKTARGDLVLERTSEKNTLASPVAAQNTSRSVDPVRLEIFHNLFMNIAQQMGAVLQNTAVSVNIKERLDFSCALFNANGELIANAPHIPVHLGSMGDSVRSILAQNPDMQSGDVFAMNAPYNGGTHLPDITVVRPVFVENHARPDYFVASRGHHADIGGRVPGSAPADSTTVEEEGILIDNLRLLHAGNFQEEGVLRLLTESPFPARNPSQNIADLKAQVASCERGAAELKRVCEKYGKEVIDAYMDHVLDNAERSVRQILSTLKGGEFSTASDDGHAIQVCIRVDPEQRTACIDFTGSSPPHPGNFNAPPAIARAAVMYAFRCLIDGDMPLNEGCLRPLQIILPTPSWISPHYPSAVFAGNVETSQLIVDALFGALGVAAASQGTMNNFLWGNATHQYYETICGGSGATASNDGQNAVQTHMTNSRLTDPEVLEWRFPVRLEAFSIRKHSGGAGKWAGGNGVVRRVRFLEPMEVNILSNRRTSRPYGMAGGQPGLSGRNLCLRRDGETEVLDGVAQLKVDVGDSIEIHTPGGGGFGTATNSKGE